MPFLLHLRFALLTAVAWTAVLGVSLAWNLERAKQQMLDQAYAEARSNVNKDLSFRRWATSHGGVYVPITATQQPAPWLAHVPGSDVVTTEGLKLTLLNPASMLRQIMDRYTEEYGIQGRITGLKYLNPGNAPDPWETEQLHRFTRGEKKEVWAVTDKDGKPYLRYLRAMVMEPGCEKCHAILGYKLGDMRGATGLNLPLTPYYQRLEATRTSLSLNHGAIWLLGLLGIGWGGWSTRLQERERSRRDAERIAATQSLEAKEAQYRALFGNMNDGVAVYRAVDGGSDFEFLDFNRAAERITRTNRDQVLGRRVKEVFPGVIDSGLLAALRRVWQSGVAESLPLFAYQDKRLSLWVENDVMRLPGGEVVAVFRDISDLKRSEEALKIDHDRLNEAQRIAKVGSWTQDLHNGQTEWSNEIFRIFEINPAQFGASKEAFLNAIHPEDREKVNRAYAESRVNRQPYEIEHRLRLPDGRIKHVQERCETLYAEDGTPLVSRGTVQDVSDLHETEEALRLYANVFSHSGEAIMITDRDNHIVAVNPAFTTLTGYTWADVHGQNPKLLASGRTPPETYQGMWSSLQETGFWQGEFWDRRKDGHIYPKWAAISLIRDEEGKITHHIASFTDISERKAAEERIHRLAHHDVLTGLLNRFSLETRLEQALLSARRENREAAVLFIDMDRFKTINDTLGHHVGDLLLIEVARRLQASVRESDIVSRLGGDEFVVVLTGLDNGMDSAHCADMIVEVLGQPYRIDGNDLHTTPSVGISIFPNDGSTPEALMKNADTAMYHAKELGRNNYQFFTTAMTNAAMEKLALERDLRTALMEQQFELHYQPKICTADGRTCGVEALVRWRHPEKGLIPPLKFIPIAEETGQIEALGEWVLDEACRQQAAWRAQGLTNARVAVNLSAHQLRSPTLVERVRAIMKKHGIARDDLELEVTESVAMDNPERAIGRLKELRDLGVTLAIDDFGTGYSSLAYLKLLPIQILKLDRAFVRDIESDENDAAISAATLALAHNLGLKVVAEGVETEGQQYFLSVHQCDFLQGYLFSKPLPAEEATAFLRRG